MWKSSKYQHITPGTCFSLIVLVIALVG
ncbi:MAG: hypothetical protein H6Q69_4888, partial [Firmicutes bacterium]|nr:hypothetical protein [Bacillota bacterium]